MKHPIETIRDLETEMFALAEIGARLDDIIKSQGRAHTETKRIAQAQLIQVDARLESVRRELKQLNDEYFFKIRIAERDERYPLIVPGKLVTFFEIAEAAQAA